MRDVVELRPPHPESEAVDLSYLFRLMTRSDQGNLHLDPGRKDCSPSGMASGSARKSSGVAVMLVDFLIGMDCWGVSGDFPHPIFFKKRLMCVIEG